MMIRELLGPMLAALAIGATFTTILCVVLWLVLWLVFPSDSKWTGAIAKKVCRDGSIVVELRDGSLWLRRSSVLAYRVEDNAWQQICT